MLVFERGEVLFEGNGKGLDLAFGHGLESTGKGLELVCCGVSVVFMGMLR